ncbi:MAG: Fungalysin metallopeptidase-domain-containing protein [Piptocephalis tieghemiana]|nr:MAG: Fungalysin metallopeptidase-domain-containing protein [Piptocephalis tieghemiana]
MGSSDAKPISLDHALSKALAYAERQLGLTAEQYVVKRHYRTDHLGVTHVYLRQLINGLEVVNGDANINVDRHGRILSMGDSFFKGPTDSIPVPNINPLDEDSTSSSTFPQSHMGPKAAMHSLNRHLQQPELDNLQVHMSHSLLGDSRPQVEVTGVPYSLSPVTAAPSYIIVRGGNAVQLVWDMQVEMEENWFNACVDAETGRVEQLIDWVSDASYRVFPHGINDPLEGDRELVVDPEDKEASPYGWHGSSKHRSWDETRGNNVVATENRSGERSGWEDRRRPKGSHTSGQTIKASSRKGDHKKGDEEDGDDLIFDFPLDLKKDPSTYVDAAVTNLFYYNNIMHDLTYKYGFDENSGNFQEDNAGRGGEGGDGVVASAQDGAGYNNANFATPPDGGHGKMRMYVWNVVEPYRDGDLESGIIVHEYTHGVSIRLTGGPDNSGCLGWGESGGMGEGWGDFLATIFRMRPNMDRTQIMAMGEYANGGKGIRKYPYSTDTSINPETYGHLSKPGYWGVHAKGAVWAEMLYEVYWNLVDKHGFTKDWYSASPNYGNTLALQLVLDGMKLQPCRPSFTDARDAILLADRQLTDGENECEIWKGFAKRGLGVGARVIGGTPWGGGRRKESFVIPERCGGDEY